MNQLIKTIKENKDTNFALRYAFDKLFQGVKDRKSDFHLLTLSTVDEYDQPQARTIVMRDFNSEKRTIRFHTDSRSKKFYDISNNNNVSLLAYDNIDKLQIRMQCEAKIYHSKEVLSDIWRKMNISSKECYSIKNSPGEIINSPFHLDYYTNNDDKKSFNNFAVVICEIKNIDLLFLHHEGHIRINYNWINKRFKGQWVIP